MYHRFSCPMPLLNSTALCSLTAILIFNPQPWQSSTSISSSPQVSKHSYYFHITAVDYKWTRNIGCVIHVLLASWHQQTIRPFKCTHSHILSLTLNLYLPIHRRILASASIFPFQLYTPCMNFVILWWGSESLKVAILILVHDPCSINSYGCDGINSYGCDGYKNVGHIFCLIAPLLPPTNVRDHSENITRGWSFFQFLPVKSGCSPSEDLQNLGVPP